MTTTLIIILIITLLFLPLAFIIDEIISNHFEDRELHQKNAPKPADNDDYYSI